MADFAAFSPPPARGKETLGSLFRVLGHSLAPRGDLRFRFEGIRQLEPSPRARARAFAASAAKLLAAAFGPGHPFFAIPPGGIRELSCVPPRADRIGTARARLLRARRLDAEEERVVEWTARLDAHEGREREALGAFRRLAARARSAAGRAAGYTGIGEIALGRGRVSDAVRAFRRSLAIEPGEAVARARLGVALALLPDLGGAASEFELLERRAREDPEMRDLLRAAGGAIPAFVRLVSTRETLRRSLQSAAPSLFPTQPREEPAELGRIRTALEGALREIASGAKTVRAAERFHRLALLRVARAAGFRAALLVRAEDEVGRVLASVPAAPAFSLLRDARIGRLLLEALSSPCVPAFELLGDSSRVAVRGSPSSSLVLLLATPHAWVPGELEFAFLAAAAKTIAERVPRTPASGPGGLLSRLPLGLAGRTAAILVRAESSRRSTIREVAGKDAALRPRLSAASSFIEAAGAGGAALASSDASPLLFPGSAAGLAVEIRWQGLPVGTLVVESRRRDLGPREIERASRFAQALAPSLRAAQFRAWAQRLFGEEPEVEGADASGDSLLARLARAARSGGPILLEGETGTGKEVLARYAHFESGRASGPFVPFLCGGLSVELAEAELFGVARGAFTGAGRTRPGLVESAAGGTLFLDEVADLAPETQAKLLRVVERRAVRRVGEDVERPADFRLLAATRRGLVAEARAGRFRADLLHRLARFRFEVPPLRGRRREIPGLVRLFARRFGSREGRRPPAVGADAVALLWRQDWPGNVRELGSFLIRCFVTVGGEVLDAEGVRRAARRFGVALRERLALRGPRAAAEVAEALRTAVAEGAPPLGRGAELLGRHPGAVARSLRALGLDRRALVARRIEF